MKQDKTRQSDESYVLPVACTVDRNMPKVVENSYDACLKCQCQCRLCRGHLTPSESRAEKTEVETGKLFEKLLKAA